MASPVTVAILDDDAVLTDALSMALSRHSDIEVVGVANSGTAGIDLVVRIQPDVVLIDYHLPDRTGASVAANIRAVLPKTAVVMLTMDSSDDTLLDTVEAGACGYIMKTAGLAEVTEALRRVASGVPLFSDAAMARLVSMLQSRHRKRTERGTLQTRLTSREMDVLRLMAEGLDSRKIAERLVVGVSTVRSHAQSVMEKLEVHSRLEAVAKAADLGLIERERPTTPR
ncbi:MAG: response regulator transcription factor [Chloroflexota bacterium]